MFVKDFVSEIIVCITTSCCYKFQPLFIKKQYFKNSGGVMLGTEGTGIILVWLELIVKGWTVG